MADIALSVVVALLLVALYVQDRRATDRTSTLLAYIAERDRDHRDETTGLLNQLTAKNAAELSLLNRTTPARAPAPTEPSPQTETQIPVGL